MENSNPNFVRRCELLAPKIIAALQARNMDGFFCRTRGDAREQAMQLMTPEGTVSWGGSATLGEVGLIDAVKKAGYKYVDRDEAPTPEKRFEAMRQAFLCDYYLTSVNAMTEDGRLVNVDGGGNRVAAMAFGPKKVIVIVGMNKVCKTLEGAWERARSFVAPVNALRLKLEKTGCAVTGGCTDCKSDESICSFLVTTRMNRDPGRMKVILVGESLGY